VAADAANAGVVQKLFSLLRLKFDTPPVLFE